MKSSILIIIPCYNEAQRLPVAEFQSFLKKDFDFKTTFLFLNDGSDDQTIDVLQVLKNSTNQIEILDLKQNVGKAEAIRQGALSIDDTLYDFIGYFDADLATPLSEITNLLETSKRILIPHSFWALELSS